MARWLVYAAVLLQALLLVLAQDAETSTESASSAANTTPASVAPTRASAPSSTMPPLIHNALNVTEAAANATLPKTNSTEQKSAASSPHAYVAMGSVLGVILCLSAI